MTGETEPRHTDEQTLTMMKNGKELFFRDKKWFPIIQEIADALGKHTSTVGPQLRKIRNDDPGIEVTTVRELERSGRSGELYPEAKPQTIICDWQNFIKIIQAYPFPSEAKKNKGNNGLAYKKAESEESKRQPPPTSKDTPTIRMPYEILAINSVKDILSHLSDGTLSQIPHDLRKYLEKVATEHVRLPRFEDDPKENILKKIFDSDSPSRLNRFFTVTLDGMLYDLWDVIDANERRLKEEKEIIETCKKLKRKGYDKKGVIQEVFTHFRIPVPESIWL